ncbi:hypothetical protein B0H13DRAFT_1896235 [Mycena leptocephala]|nr:hypothetical protein B0H13DRAFT_1896235 [Mycena leptocephala]
MDVCVHFDQGSLLMFEEEPSRAARAQSSESGVPNSNAVTQSRISRGLSRVNESWPYKSEAPGAEILSSTLFIRRKIIILRLVSLSKEHMKICENDSRPYAWKLHGQVGRVAQECVVLPSRLLGASGLLNLDVISPNWNIGSPLFVLVSPHSAIWESQSNIRVLSIPGSVAFPCGDPTKLPNPLALEITPRSLPLLARPSRRVQMHLHGSEQDLLDVESLRYYAKTLTTLSVMHHLCYSYPILDIVETVASALPALRKLSIIELNKSVIMVQPDRYMTRPQIDFNARNGSFIVTAHQKFSAIEILVLQVGPEAHSISPTEIPTKST